MSYQVLARKWRPKTFREMVGQEHVLRALINALDYDRLHHAYLFTGTRGVGKTTIARILAKCLNCDAGVSSEPCGQCSACTSIGEGRFVDLIEVDAASRTKVEDTREMLDNVQYAPTSGRYKVYLIDEVHMLSNHSFNALLKTLEEPPPHVKFLLATTDPQKLPATILSRCLQFNLKNMSPERIVGHLQDILAKEMVGFEEPALWLLGRAADGSMRDALSLADQAIAFGSGKLGEADVRSMLGTIDQSAVYDILEALVAADAARLLGAVQSLSEQAPDFVAALEELLTLLHRLAIAQALPGGGDNNLGDQERVSALAGATAAEDLQLYYQIALNGRRDLPLAPDPRSGFEMVLLRMLAFKPAGIPELPVSGLNNSAITSPTAGGPDPLKKPEAAPIAAAPQQLLPQPAANNDQQKPLTPASGTIGDDNSSPAGAKSHVGSNPGSSSNHALTNSVSAPTGTPVEGANPSAAALDSGHRAPWLEPLEEELVPPPAESDSIAVNAEILPSAVEHTQPSALENRGRTQNEVVQGNQSVSGEAGAVVKITAQAVVAAAESEPPQADSEAPITLEQLNAASWGPLFKALKFGGVVGNIASHCVLDRVEGNNLYLLLDKNNATLFNDSYTARIEEHLTVTLNALVKIHVAVAAINGETPAARKTRMIAERQQLALETIQADPNVQTLINDFTAVLDPSSVEPL